MATRDGNGDTNAFLDKSSSPQNASHTALTQVVFGYLVDLVWLRVETTF